MAEILVLVEHDGATVKKVTCELLTLARQFGEPSAVWIGAGAEGGRERLAEFGAAKVYVADGGDIEDYVVAPKAEVLAGLVARQSPAAVFVAATPEGKEVGRAAGGQDRLRRDHRRGRADPGDDGGLVAEQSIFGGAIIVQSRVRTGTPDRGGPAELRGGRACPGCGRDRAGRGRGD